MSTEHHKADQTNGQPPTNSDVRFEAADINTRTILLYLLYLAITVAATFFVSIYIFRFTTDMVAKSDTALPPMRREVGPTMPPEQEVATPKVEITEEEAMKIIVSKGLPAVPEPPAGKKK